MAALDPLANPKGVVRLCELCQKPAFVQCTDCRVTFYCGAEHQRIDFIGIHDKICHLLLSLRTPSPFANSDEERQSRKQEQLDRKKQLMNVTCTTGQKLLFEGKFAESIPAAMQSLRVAVELYGLSSIELVPSYLILGRASIGVGKLQQAEEYLLQAQWTVLKSNTSSSVIRHKLCRHLGLLHAAKGHLNDALREIANDIYYASQMYGTFHINTSGGYFHMGNIFYRLGNIATACSLFEEVTEIWHKHLWKTIVCRLDTSRPADYDNTAITNTTDDDQLGETEQAEALQVLTAIFGVWEENISKKPDSVAKTAHSLAMLYFIMQDMEKAKEFGRKAVGASGRIQDAEFTRNMVEFLKMCENIKPLME